MRLVALSLTLLPLVIGCAPDTEIEAGSDTGAAVGTADGPAAQLRPETVGEIVLRPTAVLGGSLALLVPEGFSPMDPAMLRKKYRESARPSLVFSNETGSVNIVLDHGKNAVPAGQIRQLHQTLDAGLRRQFPDANWQYSGVRNYGGRKWAQLEFISSAQDTKIHNIMVASSVEGQMLAASFNVTEELAPQWLPVGRRIIENLAVTE